MEPSSIKPVKIDGTTFGADGDPRREFLTTAIQYRHPRKWLIAIWAALGIACVVGAIYLVVTGRIWGVALLPVALLTNYMRSSEAEEIRQSQVTGLAARHGDEAIVLIPKSRPFMSTYVDRAWLFPAGSVQYATYENGFVRVSPSGALDIGMRGGRKVVQNESERDRIRIRIEGEDAEADGRAVADILFSSRIAAEDVPADLDQLSELFE